MLSENNNTDFEATILVVDDNPVVRSLLVGWLNDAGYTHVESGCVADAWASLGQIAAPPLATLDTPVTGHSRVVLPSETNEPAPSTEILVIRADDKTHYAVSALTLRASAYPIKPVVADELLVQVGKALERRQFQLKERHYTRRLEDRVVEQTRELCWAHEETIHRLVAAASCRDEETGAHIRRTGLLSEALALAAGWSPSEAGMLRLAAPMHDVGKIGIPDAILQKPGGLSQVELELMKRHTTIGAQMLGGSASPVLQLAEQVALCHHECWDGSGYPRGLVGEAIPEAARIVSIVDVYDALTHDRVYRPAFSEQEALSMMRAGQGTQFDPGLLALFLADFEHIHSVAESHPDVTDEKDIYHTAPNLSVFDAIPTLLGAPV